MKRLAFILFGLCLTGLFTGCWGKKDQNQEEQGVSASGKTLAKYEKTEVPDGVPVFIVRISEYPSWSHFLVADAWGLIDKRKGWQGEYERQYGIDIECTSVDYDTCITEYGNGTCDATCLTNIDVLKPSTTRPTVAILPSSTSNGADAAVTVGVEDVAALKGIVTRGLEDSVAQYCFERNIELNGLSFADYPFQQQDPGAAAQAMMQGQEGYESIQVWNPFVITVLEKRDGSNVLFDSTTIPEEIIDMVVVGQDVLRKPKGNDFAQCLVDVYYATCRYYGEALGDDLLSQSEAEELASRLSSDEGKSVVALSKLAGFDVPGPSMVRAVRMTRFFYTPEKGKALFQSKKFQTETMKVDGPVDRFCKRNIDGYTTPKMQFGATGNWNADLVFDTSFMERQ